MLVIVARSISLYYNSNCVFPFADEPLLLISPSPPKHVKGLSWALEIYQTMAPIYFTLSLSSISRCYCLMVQSGPQRRCTYDVCFPASVSFSCCAEPVSCLDFPPSYAPSAPILPTGKVTLRQLFTR